MQEIIIRKEYEIARTGDLQQQYTLFLYQTVVGGGFGFFQRQYYQNVGATEEKAITTSEKITGCKVGEQVKKGNTIMFLDLIDSPREIYQTVKCFNLHWKNTTKGYTTEPDSEFWNIWKMKKDCLKELGFRCFKADSGKFLVFISKDSVDKILCSGIDVSKVVSEYEPKKIQMKYFETLEEAKEAYDKLSPVSGYMNEHFEKAKQHESKREESFSRCETDGFVTQHCEMLTMQEELLKHKIMVHGGQSIFPALVDLKTDELVSTQLHVFNNQYYDTVCKFKLRFGGYVSNYKKESSFAKKGFKKVWIIAPAIVRATSPFDHRPELKGFSGLSQISYSAYINYEELGINF